MVRESDVGLAIAAKKRSPGPSATNFEARPRARSALDRGGRAIARSLDSRSNKSHPAEVVRSDLALPSMSTEMSTREFHTLDGLLIANSGFASPAGAAIVESVWRHGFRSAGRNAKKPKAPTQGGARLRTSSGSADRRRRANLLSLRDAEGDRARSALAKADATTSWVDPGNRALTGENPGEGT